MTLDGHRPKAKKTQKHSLSRIVNQQQPKISRGPSQKLLLSSEVVVGDQSRVGREIEFWRSEEEIRGVVVLLHQGDGDMGGRVIETERGVHGSMVISL